ncbi:hypothetical protein T01_15774 [Trichinella spiralis]|uniref:PiggyBac transposable element-derived protein domain-containing protein n=1 Tax=Trichinella spiralis TaxID=6334 RepID=A0A0V1BRP9_TRISP|nr:hypothetical protein T01_15774 [Trichinella spiralis]
MHTKFSGQIEKSSKSQCENGQLLKSTHGKLSCHAAVFKRALLRSGEQRQIGLANTIVEQLAQPFLNPNRNAFMDRYFTSFSTVEYFPEHGLRAVDTVSAHHRDVPARLRETARH